MSYNPDDSDSNRNNPTSPSAYMTMNEQLMYKLAALDASVQSGFRRLDEKMDRFQTDLHENQIETNDRINRLEHETKDTFAFKRQRIDALTLRVAALETWQKISMARVAILVGAVSFLWVLVAPAVRQFFGLGG